VGSPFASHITPARKRINWPKHAAFTVLVVVGLIFWLPDLLRATVFDTPETAGSLDDATRARETSSPAEGTDAIAKSSGTVADSFADTLPTVEKPRSATENLVLTITILGKLRRAAIVNGRLHREGDRILAAGELFRLTRVADDSVELLREGGDAGSNADGRAHGDAAGDGHLTIRISPQHGPTTQHNPTEHSPKQYSTKQYSTTR